ncbi:hypothetical protein [Marinovum sp.]|uniref:hypothetical protein n=1 Tax=Marinovum sp. TaxID=2024839 RepID=UPI002B270A54|nr:hypothetical protein [Marinovum sp.]
MQDIGAKLSSWPKVFETFGLGAVLLIAEAYRLPNMPLFGTAMADLLISEALQSLNIVVQSVLIFIVYLIGLMSRSFGDSIWAISQRKGDRHKDAGRLALVCADTSEKKLAVFLSYQGAYEFHIGLLGVSCLMTLQGIMYLLSDGGWPGVVLPSLLGMAVYVRLGILDKELDRLAGFKA